MKWIGSLFLLMGLSSPALASCGSSFCSTDAFRPYLIEKGEVELRYSFDYIDQNQPRIGRRQAAVGELHGHHDEERTINRLHRVSGTWGVTDRISLDLGLPYVSRSHRHTHQHHGQAIPEGWDFSGVGDLLLQARYAFYKPDAKNRPTLSILAGAEFPTGESHITNANHSEAEPGITHGSDSYDVVVGFSALQYLSAPTLKGPYVLLPIFLTTQYQMNGRGHDEYRLGNTFTATTGVIYPLLPWLGAQTQLNAVVKERDDRGDTREETGKTGGEYLYVSPGIVIHMGPHWDWQTLVQIPVYQRVNQIRLTSDYNLQTSVAYRFKI